MTHLPTIINDLAMILLVAGVTTILFKKINQPLVLGYIVAGFITGPHFNFFPTITDKANVHAWSEIGVIFLLFALGLEFSFYKLKSVGSTAFIATAVEIGGMLAVKKHNGKPTHNKIPKTKIQQAIPTRRTQTKNKRIFPMTTTVRSNRRIPIFPVNRSVC